jgi:peptide/nickel transport system permease protein
MHTYVLKRLLMLPPMMLGITFISFCVMQLAPGQSGATGSGEKSASKLTRDQQDVMNRTFHLDQPIHMRYLYWLGAVQPKPGAEELKASAESGAPIPLRGVIFGDFGQSMETKSISVWTRLRDAIPITVVMNLISIVIMYFLAIPLGIFSATHQDSRADRSTTVVLFALYSLPSFWVAVLLIKLMVSPWWLDALRLPFQGYQPTRSDQLTTLEWIWGCMVHLTLPMIVMTYASFAGLSRYMRSSMIDVIRADFVRTARAKGLREFLVVYKHALRNSLIPMITLLGGLLPGMISGSVILETIFGIPGMGYVAYHALLARDYTVLMADLTIVGFLVLIGFLISDLLYTIADPRISFEKGAR